ncbi:MAG: HTH domain-containing protein, partial [Oscillospiraceae bacterium]
DSDSKGRRFEFCQAYQNRLTDFQNEIRQPVYIIGQHFMGQAVIAIKSRHLEVLIYLLKNKKTTYKQLAHHFEVSVKTIERDINRLSSMGIPVYCTQGVGGGVRIDESYKFSTSFFTDSDIHQIIFALTIADSLSTVPKKESIINKLCLIAPELSVLFENDAQQYFSIDLISEKVSTDDPVYEKINHCLDDELYAIINGAITVAPIGYVLKSDGLYLFCFSAVYELMKCSDIRTIEPTEIEFEREFISYEEYKKTSRQT